MEKIVYVGRYDIIRNGEQKRVYSLAAAKKMHYIAQCLTSLGYKVDMVSYAQTGEKIVNDNKLESREVIFESCELVLPPLIGAKNKLEKGIRILRTKGWLFWYLVKNCKKDSKVIVYHSHEVAIPLVLAQLLRRFKPILEVEEKYAEVWKLSKFQCFKENLLLKYAKEGSIVVSEALAEKLNIDNPIIAYGNYKTYKGKLETKEHEEQIKLIYTGSIDKTKGSAFIAVQMMKYLSEKYLLYISGPIVEKDRVDFFEILNEINKIHNKEVVKYLGILDDRAYEKLLLSADIALNPQKEGDFGEYLFPSKILTYMSYGIPVISTKGKSIVKSKVNDLIIFSDSFEPSSVAETVKNFRISDRNLYIERLEFLNYKFMEDLKNILN